ncbi:transglutaminase family protein [Okibacterium fritillariae]|uniref:Transglutaminase-like superfamily protein n=1 Tax=Okibacterium fritillariae TaxID=123320 RepID=A0A1T5K5W6_9MICO|nr:transglutaminase domain-containing protein [Okibacterium fritillariae]SKC59116.1 Transglutaminase-like superfamily protein [Okibacterium fritillariae]
MSGVFPQPNRDGSRITPPPAAGAPAAGASGDAAGVPSIGSEKPSRRGRAGRAEGAEGAGRAGRTDRAGRADPEESSTGRSSLRDRFSRSNRADRADTRGSSGGRPPRTPRPPAAPRPPLPRGTVTPLAWRDLGVVSFLSLIGLWGFAPAFSDNWYLLAGFGGLLVGTAAGYLSHRWRLNALLTALLALVGYFVFGSAFAVTADALAGVVPTLVTLRSLALGAVFGWRDILTLAPPVGAPEYINVLPYVAAWLVGLVTAILTVRWMPRHDRTPGRLAVLLSGPAALYIFSVVIGTERPFFAAARGIVFAAVALVWLSWRRSSAENVSLQDRSGLVRSKLLGTGAVVLAAALVAGLGAGLLTPPSADRVVVREHVQPPFDPEEYPSPLSGFRQYTKNLAETDLFEVTGLEKGDRLRLATMDTYDGELWKLAPADVQTDGSGSFQLVSRQLPAPELLTAKGSRNIDVQVTGYQGPWLPVVGYPTGLELPETPDKSQDLRFNADTATAVVTSGIGPKFTYDLQSVLQTQPSDDALADVPVASVTLPAVQRVPSIVKAKTNEFVGDATSPIGKLRAIENNLKTSGYLSHGLASDTATSRAGHGADRMEELFTRNQLIGDQEQYASAFALMARQLGYPARVVMGFAPENVSEDGATKVTGNDVTAWVEVPFEGVGWVQFDPTPDETEIPQDQNPKPKTEPQPQVRQPPRVDKRDEDLLTNVEIDDSNDEKKDDQIVVPTWMYGLAAALAAPILAYLIPFLIVMAIKRRRVKRRRNAPTPDRQAAGAWDELLDRHAEYGVEVPQGMTRRATAAALAAAVPASASAKPSPAAGHRSATAPDPRVPAPSASSMPPTSSTGDSFAAVARDADRAVFAGEDVPAANVDAIWDETERRIRSTGSAVGWWRRQRSRFRVNSKRRVSDRLTAPGHKPKRSARPAGTEPSTGGAPAPARRSVGRASKKNSGSLSSKPQSTTKKQSTSKPKRPRGNRPTSGQSEQKTNHPEQKGE